MSPRKLASSLGLSVRQVQRNLAAGMPADAAGALAWRDARVRPAVDNTVDAADIHELRARLIRAQGEGERMKNRLREFELAAASADLVPVETAHEVVHVVVTTIRRALPGLDGIARRVNPTDTALAADALKEWRSRLEKLLARADESDR